MTTTFLTKISVWPKYHNLIYSKTKKITYFKRVTIWHWLSVSVQYTVPYTNQAPV